MFDGNQVWYNRAWLYTDIYKGDMGFKHEFTFLRETLGRTFKDTNKNI